MNESPDSYKHAYRSGAAPLWLQVVAPLLKHARLIRRAAGFFDSSVFEINLPLWHDFIMRGGRFKLVCSPTVCAGDAEALYRGLYEANRFRAIPVHSLLLWATTRATRDRAGTRMLAWLVANDRLEVFIAVPVEGRGVYHEKFALIASESGEVAFSGSANETLSGYVRNFERLDVVRSTGATHERKRMLELSDEFQRLVRNQTSGLSVYSLHEAFVRRVLNVRTTIENEDRVEEEVALPDPPPELLRMATDVELRRHQVEAIDAWFGASGRGIYSMATGSGKTLAALSTAVRVYERKGGPFVVVVVAPYLVLVDQWVGEMRRFGLYPIRCADARRTWEPYLRAAIYQSNVGSRPVLSVVASNATFALDAFQDCLASIGQRTLIIGDEVHNLGARKLRRALPARVTLRLGLSATPKKWMDEEGTAAIRDYFGAAVSSFTIADALAAKPPVLCSYYYYPVLVELAENEVKAYLRTIRRLSALLTDPLAEALSDDALRLMLEQSRVLSKSVAKLDALREKLEPYKDRTHTLVYCGDGGLDISSTLGDEDAAEDAVDGSQVDHVVRLLNHELGIVARKYTSRESQAERAELLSAFRNGHIQALVAIRCLDEGVDVPNVERAFILESSSNPRQFIQRRGRVLRPSPGKRYAEIFDFITAPPVTALDPDTREFRTVRGMLSRELERVAEFCSTAQNAHRARASLLPLTSRFGLNHL